jgi:hypothetical protein
VPSSRCTVNDVVSSTTRLDSGSPTQSDAWVGHSHGSTEYRRLLAGLFFAGVATFAQLYSPQAALPLIAADLKIGAADAALIISAATIGLAIGVIPWSVAADRFGRVRAMSIAVTAATVFGLLVPSPPAGMIAFLALIAGVLAVLLLRGTDRSTRRHEESPRPSDLAAST